MSLRRFVLALSLALAPAAFGETTTRVTSDKIERTGDLANATKPSEEGKPSFVALPIPLSDPAIGTGITLVAAMLYNPNESVRPWVTGGGANVSVDLAFTRNDQAVYFYIGEAF